MISAVEAVIVSSLFGVVDVRVTVAATVDTFKTLNATLELVPRVKSNLTLYVSPAVVARA